jgi:hypothetical protein
MNIYLDCIPCFLRQGLDAARRVTDDVSVHERIIRDVLRLASELDMDLPPPWVGQLIHRRLRELIGEDDPYRTAKSGFNALALEMLPRLATTVRSSPDPLAAAVKVAIASNVIDLGVESEIDDERVVEALRGSCGRPFYGDWEQWRRRVGDAERILYLADNAGEIAMDRLLIEELGPERVTVAVRGSPVINDATVDDAEEVGLHELVEIIDNGSDAPGTILDDCSASFKERFREADLLIAKGQGNFETLSETDAEVFFLLKLKCPVIARHVGLPTGTHALLYSKDRRRPDPEALAF